MKISLNWIQDFVDVSEYKSKPQELADLLTNKGLEVESIENKAKDFSHVVVGHILERGQHPNADRLTLCQVSTGDGKVHQIVCGAKNHKANDRVVVALPGAILPGNFQIKLSKIRDVESQGMLCSEKELGLSEESEGIMILDSNAPVGKSFAEYMGFDDIIFELKVTPNRADCLSHWGLAREISCLLNKPLKPTWNKVAEAKESSLSISVNVEEIELCPRYTGIPITGVKVQASPEWLKRRVESSGMKSINNIVDITNYVMLELGQPLHAFDTREILGNKIKVSKAKPNEKFKTLDGTELTLNGTELMIRDSERSIALAGVVGGANSGIQEDTTQVFLESAFFKMESVRKTARTHGIQTESSYRFSRGIDPDLTFLAAQRAASLIQEIASGEISKSVIDTNPQPLTPKVVSLTINDLEDRLGYKISKDQFTSWMKRLGCQVQDATDIIKVQVPLFRQDISLKEDLVEEFARLHGFENIPEVLPLMGAAPTNHHPDYLMAQRIHKHMRSFGYNEAFNFSFVSLDYQNKLNTLNEKPGFKFDSQPIKIKNPLSDELNVMRQSLFSGLLQNCFHNCRHNQEAGSLYELGYVFDQQKEEYVQNWNLAAVKWGSSQNLWTKNQNTNPFFELKTFIENLMKSLSIKSYRFEEAQVSYLHPGQTACLRAEGKLIGYIGTVHPQILEDSKIRVPVAFCELNLDTLLKGQPRKLRTKSISKFPMVERDLAFVLPKNMMAADLLPEIQKAAAGYLKNSFIFDVFEGAPLQEDQKSVAYRMVFQDAEKTLSEEDLKKLETQIINAVKQKFSISVR